MSLKIQLLCAGVLTVLAISPIGAQSNAPAFLITNRSSLDFDGTLNRLKGAIEAENLMVVHEINPQQMLRMVGVRTGGMRQILFFHPRYMKQIIEANRNAGIEPPLKLLVMESPGGAVMVRYEDPLRQFADYPGIGDIATELNELVARIVGTVR